jgi:Ca2+-binding RTX toxin-like protein
MTTAQERLNSILPSWYELLTQWSSDGSLVAAATEALVLDGSNAKKDAKGQLQSLTSQWSAKNFKSLPQIVLLSNEDISGAQGAYADSTDTIYLNADWLLTASEKEIQKVLTEELGHSLDDQLNLGDTKGDEGEYFSYQLFNGALSPERKTNFSQENDSITLNLSNTSIFAEASASNLALSPDAFFGTNGLVNLNYGNPASLQERIGDVFLDADGSTFISGKIDGTGGFVTKIDSRGKIITSFGASGWYLQSGLDNIYSLNNTSFGLVIAGTKDGEQFVGLLNKQTGAIIAESQARTNYNGNSQPGIFDELTSTLYLPGVDAGASGRLDDNDISLTAWKIGPNSLTLNTTFAYDATLTYNVGRADYVSNTTDSAKDQSGNIYMGGMSRYPDSSSAVNEYWTIASFTPSGSANDAFSSDGIISENPVFEGTPCTHAYVSSVAINNAGNLVVLGGVSVTQYSQPFLCVQVYNPDGSIISTNFVQPPSNLNLSERLRTSNIAKLKDGSFIFAYTANLPDGSKDNVLVKLTSDGTLDTSFGANGYQQIQLQGDQVTYDYDYISRIEAVDDGTVLIGFKNGGGSCATLLRYTYGTTVIGDSYINTLIGTDSADRISGKGVPTTGGKDIIDGKGGSNDVVFESGDYNFKISGTSASSMIIGSTTKKVGGKTVTATYISDSITSVEGVEISGGNSANTLDASAYSGNSNLNGAGGADTLIGGIAADILTGGVGADIFRFSVKQALLSLETADRITDFKSAESDKIQVARSVFGIASTTKVMYRSTTSVGLAAALNTSSLFVLDTTSGELWLNNNSTAAGAGTGGVFAVLDKNSIGVVPTLTASNFALF